MHGFAATCPAEHVEAANAALESAGFGPGNFSVPLFDGLSAGRLALHCWTNDGFRAAIQALPAEYGVEIVDAGETPSARVTTAAGPLEWRTDWATAGDLPMLGDTREKDGTTWESLRDENFWPVGVLAGWKPVLAAVVQWSPSGVYTQPQTVTDAEGTRQWQLQTETETAAVGREPWQAHMWAVWQEVT